ncbi:dCTP deaminase domain-containing protein [Planococcus faecalis]|uniref:dUTPase-like domain-containing protein n=1 Tax=Planococcus faecalis TaxID=1598147 RepID=A0ABM6IRR8_9BACL|nr:hypothetical protein [Planococcus faecalis]AQU78998.1 hypothetical protein AJGP001_06880 [Planococcus faecalis]OHX54736.1 hypothetical protein BB777_06185 [Planococcus faecalis]
MTIIPFINSNDNYATIITEKSKFKLDGKEVCIVNLDDEQFSDEMDSNVSYDLRVGESYRDHIKNKTVSISENQNIRLKPGAALIIETEEEVHFPLNKFGQILPKVKLLEKGVSNTTSKIDPGYQGSLTITLFNLGKETIFLDRKEKFCSLIIQDIADGARPYQKKGKKLPNTKKNILLNDKVNVFVKDNATIITILISLMSLAAIVVSSYAAITK